MRFFNLKSNICGDIGLFYTDISENIYDDDKIQEIIAEIYYSCGNNQIFICHLKTFGIFKINDVEPFFVD